MDVAVILTYRCNSKCSMCYVWQNPSLPKEEVSLETLAKIPVGIDYLNLTGGEPTLREDLPEIVDLLYPKAMQVEISSNGLHAEKLESIVKKYPCIKIRFSLDGMNGTNNIIRGERDGYAKKVQGMRRLKELGAKDLGFGVTIQDGNSDQLADLFRLAQECGVELATSTLHNGFQFHKNDNWPYDRRRVAKQIEGLIAEQLKTYDVKTWFRAYVNMGLMAKVLGRERLLRCSAGSDFAFIDPWGDAYACNVRPDLKLGNLEEMSWDQIFRGEAWRQATAKVAACQQNCWMVGSAKTAMRNPRFAKLPKTGPLWWVIRNKVRVTLGLPVDFSHYVDFSHVREDANVTRRTSYLDQTAPKRIRTKQEIHYVDIGEFENW
jgi:Fe-coproporphyrin III synthase